MITMEHYKHYNVSKKRKDKFKNLAMSLKSGLLIIVLSILMTRIKVTSGKQSDWNYISRFNLYTVQPRHYNHYSLNKKYKDHHKGLFFDKLNSHYNKKESRFPILNKISNRLDNRIEIRLEHLESTTIKPFDDWEFITPNATDLHEKYSYTVDNEPVTVKSGEKLRHSKHIAKDEWNEFDDPYVEFGSDSKGLLHLTTPKPWEHEQRDVAFHGLGSGSSKSNKNDLSYSPVKVQSYVAAQEEPVKIQQTQHSRTFKRPTKKEIEEMLKRSRAKAELDNSPDAEATRNAEKIKREWKCQLPKARIIRVHDVHPDSTKSYTPSCAIVHQCSDDTGCCHDYKQVCKPKNITKIEISFFMVDHARTGMKTVKKLTFDNHTECECRNRQDDIFPEQNDSEIFSQKIIRPSTAASVNDSKCKCPSQYSVRYSPKGTCSCDCFDKQEECLTLKRGKKQFLLADQLCIQQSTCLPPSCSYGVYIRNYGRCPKKQEYLRQQHLPPFGRNIT